jgi:hypothetical protein
MKLLPLDFTHRNYLLNRYALVLDGDGNETLAALSCSESLDYLVLFEYATKGVLPTSLERLSYFLAMHERHTAALPSSLWMANALYGMKHL